jgi:hypothetical protein
LVEQRIENPRVDGSIPSQATKIEAPLVHASGVFYFLGPDVKAYHVKHELQCSHEQKGEHMPSDQATHQKVSLWRRFLAFKGLLLAFSLAGLLASNVASLVSASAHDWMHNALWRVLSIGGQTVADRALANSPKAKLDQTVKTKTADLEAKNRLQAKELEDVHVKNRKLAQQLDVNGKQAKAC